MNDPFNPAALHRRLTEAAYTVTCGRGPMGVEERNQLSALLHEAAQRCGGPEVTAAVRNAVAEAIGLERKAGGGGLEAAARTKYAIRNGDGDWWCNHISLPISISQQQQRLSAAPAAGASMRPGLASALSPVPRNMYFLPSPENVCSLPRSLPTTNMPLATLRTASGSSPSRRLISAASSASSASISAACRAPEMSAGEIWSIIAPPTSESMIMAGRPSEGV